LDNKEHGLLEKVNEGGGQGRYDVHGIGFWIGDGRVFGLGAEEINFTME
jgi:hypothetical protein